MIVPGEILTLKVINCRDYRGHLWCRSLEKGDMRSDSCLSESDETELRQRLKKDGLIKVVAVGIWHTKKGPRPVFAFDTNFESKLISYFYEWRKGKLIGTTAGLDQWINRWADGAARYTSVDCQEPFSTKLAPPSPFIQWKTISTEQWRMPVFAEKQCRWLTGPYRYCSSEQYEYGFFSPSATRTSPLFPYTFKTSLHNSLTGETQQATVVLHGFMRPKLWHFKFRIHVACASPISDRYTRTLQGGSEEREWWEHYLKTPIPLKSLFQSANCQDHPSGQICGDCDQKTFTHVHGTINDCLEEYTAFAVTIFQEAATREMRIKKYPGGADRWRVAIECRDNEKEIMGYAPKLCMEGVCFDWGSETPMIHLFFRSFFTQRLSADMWPADSRRDPFWKSGFDSWSVTNVSK